MQPQVEARLHYAKEDSSDSNEIPISHDDVLIGRAAECDVRLDDSKVSRFHASLKAGPEGYWLTDMESTNGTIVDDQRIPPNRRTAIRPFQAFRIGSYVFRVQIPGQEPAAAAPKTEEATTPDGTVLMTGVQKLFMYDLAALRKDEFSHLGETTYLDSAAASPIPARSLKKMATAPGGPGAADWLTAFRTAAAKFLNASSPDEISLIRGYASGMDLFARSLGLGAEDNVIFCDREDPASVSAWLDLGAAGVEIKIIPSLNGGLALEELKQVANARTRIVAASAFQAFTGHRTDLAAIGKFCRERQILFVVDASQAIGHTPMDVQKLEVDVLVTGGSRSLMALPGSGFLYCREAVAHRLKSPPPLPESLHYPDDGGGAGGRFLTGRPDPLSVVSMTESMGLIDSLTRDAIDRHTTSLAAHTLDIAKERGYEPVTALGEHGPIATFKSKSDPGTALAFINKMRTEDHIALETHRDRSDHAFIRMSFHCYNEEAEIARAFDALDKMK